MDEMREGTSATMPLTLRTGWSSPGVSTYRKYLSLYHSPLPVRPCSQFLSLKDMTKAALLSSIIYVWGPTWENFLVPLARS